ncbi:MAG: hypothetical protein FJ090_17865 [Deltaproteobacteria bacterium]|nr:hypothetical protein [Deltaproteobacteria bacterium]
MLSPAIPIADVFQALRQNDEAARLVQATAISRLPPEEMRAPARVVKSHPPIAPAPVRGDGPTTLRESPPAGDEGRPGGLPWWAAAVIVVAAAAAAALIATLRS